LKTFDYIYAYEQKTPIPDSHPAVDLYPVRPSGSYGASH
jgi:hypothetical protein